MPRRVGFVLAFTLLCAACSGRPKSHVVDVPPSQPAAVGGVPSWVPPYSPAQLELLKPVEHPIQLAVPRVFPDLSRFGYAKSKPMASLEEGVKMTRMVAKVINESPRFYALGEASPDLANSIAQYGPPADAEPNGWLVPKGEALVVAMLSKVSRDAYDKAQALLKEHDFEAAERSFRIAVASSPEVPELRHALARTLINAGKLEGAEAVLGELIARDPTFASAHVALAEIYERRNDPTKGRRAIIEALAYAPGSKRAAEVAIRYGASPEMLGDDDDPKGPFPIPIFLDVDAVGAIHVAASSAPPHQIYAGCRAVMRYEPDVRATIFEEPTSTPYFLSAVEEVVCLEAALGAYMVDRAEGEAEEDDDLDELLAVARSEGLAGYAMFHILGPRRPERTRTAPLDVHRAIATYVERHVMSKHDGPDDAPNQAKLMHPDRSLLGARR
jgi:tetratricopeptide (TPR) repeat protein